MAHVAAALVLAAGAPEAAAQTAAPQAALARVLGGLAEPVLVTHAGDGSGRLFIVEKGGRVRIARGGRLLPAPLLDISGRVLNAGEQGLLGLAFPPGFAASRRFYVYFTNRAGDNVLARYRVSADPDRASGASREVLLTLPHPQFSNHNGGMIAFGPDGYLYVGTGDGGGSGDPFGNAQDPGSLLGKLLRLDVEGPASGYAIPPDNPFAGVPGARGEVWALGLRNPWRFSFDRGGGDLVIGDVGQNAHEEIDHLPAGTPGGANFGWDLLEGDACFPPGSACAPPPSYVAPVLTYPHEDGCSVTGGYVSRFAGYPQLFGLYLYADFCAGWVRAATPAAGPWASATLVDTGKAGLASFGEDEGGAVHVADLLAGTVLRLVSPVFGDSFSTPAPGAAWETAAGAWSVDGAGRLAPDPVVRSVVLVAPGVVPPARSGRVDVKVTLPVAGRASAEIVFAAQDASRYRFVRLTPGRVSIGQVGSFGGVVRGVKRAVAAPVTAGAEVAVRVEFAPSGRVRVHLDGAANPAARFRFARAVRGRVGLAADRSAAAFDDFLGWDRFAGLPGP